MSQINNVFSKSNKNLLLEMVRTDFKLRYQGSVLGYSWSLLKPLMLFGVLYAVFTQFLRFDIDPLSLLLGVILWNFFVESTSVSLTSILANGELIRKIKLPKYLIVLSSTVAALINLFLALIIVFIFVIIFGSGLSVSVLLFPLIIIELYVLCLGLAFFLSTLYVKFRDVSYIWEVVLQIGFFATPIIYPLLLIENEQVRAFMLLNPVAQLLQDGRAVLTERNIPVDQLAEGQSMITEQVYDAFSFPYALIPHLFVIAIFAVGTLYFKKQSANFAENL